MVVLNLFCLWLDIVDTNKLNLLETSVVLPILDECIDYLCILKSALPENIEHRKAKLLYQAPKQRCITILFSYNGPKIINNLDSEHKEAIMNYFPRKKS